MNVGEAMYAGKRTMTSRERLLAVYNNELPDRVPIWMMFPLAGDPYIADVHNLEAYQEVVPWVMENTDFIERSATNVDFLPPEKLRNV